VYCALFRARAIVKVDTYLPSYKNANVLLMVYVSVLPKTAQYGDSSVSSLKCYGKQRYYHEDR